jgi:hypothetical protein
MSELMGLRKPLDNKMVSNLKETKIPLKKKTPNLKKIV